MGNCYTAINKQTAAPYMWINSDSDFTFSWYTGNLCSLSNDKIPSGTFQRDIKVKSGGICIPSAGAIQSMARN